MISKEKKLELTNAITSSLVFQKSPKSSALLLYLVKANINNSFLKEDIIDHEFFGSKSNFDKTNPRVRVNIYNLRKKLKRYYETEGSETDWKIIIEKGQYSVQFEKQLIGKKFLSSIKLKNVLPYIITALVCVLFYIKSLAPTPSTLWEEFYTNKKTTTLYIGDAFGITGTTVTGGEGWTRDFNINNTEQYYKLIEQKPELREKTNPAHYSYITAMGAHASHNIAQLFQKYKSDFDIRFSSKITVADLKKGNTIYVGPIRNENKFISLFNNENPFFKIDNNKLIYSKDSKETTQEFAVNSNTESMDIAIVSRIPGPQNTAQFIFFSNHDMGVTATVEYFTNTDSLNVFEKQLKGKYYFTAIYQAKGEDRTNLSLETLLVVPF